MQEFYTPTQEGGKPRQYLNAEPERRTYGPITAGGTHLFANAACLARDPTGKNPPVVRHGYGSSVHPA
jgi:hypothetical protein